MRIKRENHTYSIKANDRYLSKSECYDKAQEIVREKHIIGMTNQELASEIYFHAWAYHIACLLESKNITVLARVKDAADPIDLADYGDKWFRKVFYAIFWLFPQKHFKAEDISNKGL